MKSIFVSLAVLMACHTAHAASGMASLYIQSAAAWERCTGRAITPGQATNLSTLIARHSLESVTPEELLNAIEKARIATPPNCELPLVMIDRDYFENFVFPRISTNPELRETSTTNARVAGT